MSNLPAPVFRRAIADSWRAWTAWAVGLIALMLLYLPLYRDISGGQFQELLDSLPSELINILGYDQIGTGTGYTQATLFSLTGYLLMSIAAISWGSAAIAGAEESGRLELELSHSVGRVQYALESFAAILARLVGLGLVIAITLALLNDPAGLEISGEGIAAGCLAIVSLCLVSAAAALAVGALTGRRSLATGAGALVAIYGYVLNALANQSTDLEWLRDWSPFAWAYRASPLEAGFVWRDLVLLWAASALFAAVATIALRGRDITG